MDTPHERIKIDLAPSQMQMFCFAMAVGVQLDRKMLARDMRRTAELLTQEAPQLAASAADVTAMANAIENMSAALAGDMAKMFEALGSGGVH